ncbi:unnamed protein product [Macrosiphum euphorbiae]|nr:unnamed protein product [Macrosiphum euphorbiae]
MYPRNNAIINNGWANVENGTYNLQDFLRNVSYTSEQILRNEIGEPDFQPMLAIQGLNAIPPGQLPQRPPQLLLRPMPVPPLIRPAVQPPIAEVVPVAIQPAEAVQLPMVEVPAIAVQNVRNQRGVRRRGNRGNRVQGNGRGRLNARVGWAEFFANIEDEVEPRLPPPVPNQHPIPANEMILEVCIICYEEVVTVTIVPCRHTFCNTCITRLIQDGFNTCPLCRGNIEVYEGYV